MWGGSGCGCTLLCGLCCVHVFLGLVSCRIAA